MALSLAAGAAQGAGSGIRTVCGVRAGTAGNAPLVDKHQNDVIVLATQGRDQSLLEQADGFIGPDKAGDRGTQNGTRYCLKVRFDESGKPVAIVGGRRG